MTGLSEAGEERRPRWSGRKVNDQRQPPKVELWAVSTVQCGRTQDAGCLATGGRKSNSPLAQSNDAAGFPPRRRRSRCRWYGKSAGFLLRSVGVRQQMSRTRLRDRQEMVRQGPQDPPGGPTPVVVYRLGC